MAEHQRRPGTVARPANLVVTVPYEAFIQHQLSMPHPTGPEMCGPTTDGGQPRSGADTAIMTGPVGPAPTAGHRPSRAAGSNNTATDTGSRGSTTATRDHRGPRVRRRVWPTRRRACDGLLTARGHDGPERQVPNPGGRRVSHARRWLSATLAAANSRHSCAAASEYAAGDMALGFSGQVTVTNGGLPAGVTNSTLGLARIHRTGRQVARRRRR